MIGQTLDRYKIESKLGEGGMGVVYKARDTHLNRTVAIKLLPPDKIADPDRRRRFVHEAKAASALNHPGIVTVYDIRSDAGVDFIVMEHVAGTTLDQIITPKGLRVSQALRYAIGTADALAKAHEAGIVHRDLKPSNVMVTEEDRVKILDFGLAKLIGPAEGSDGVGSEQSALTEVGVVVGTVSYMSPEQAEGRRLDARSDIFSFGSMLFQMVTGRKPFVGDSALATMSKIMSEDPPPPSQIAPSIPRELERTILRCLRKDPARRYQTMADLKVTLEDLASDWSSGSQAAAVSVPVARRPRWLWPAIISIPLLLVGAYFAGQFLRPPESAPEFRALPLASMAGVKRSPSFSPDGRQVAFTWTGPARDNTDLYVQQIGAGTPLRLTTDPADDYSPVWSPDGRSIAFLRRQSGDVDRHDLRLIPPLGGPERKLTEIHPRRGFLRPLSLTWCADSSCVVVTDSPGELKPDALFAVSVESGEKRQLTNPQDPVFADRDPAVSPDGNWLVFVRDITPFTGELFRLRLGPNATVTGDPVRLAPTESYAYHPTWMPDSTEILYSAKGALWRLGMADGSTPRRLPFVGEDGVMPMVARGRPGEATRLAYVRSFATMNIWRVETAGLGIAATSAPVLAISSTRRDGAPDFSPDGLRVAFTSDRSGELEVWIADAGGANAVQITSMAAFPAFPRWSPDGESIAFQSNTDDAGDIFLVAAGGGKPRNVSIHAAGDTLPSFSRDGQWIYYSSNRAGAPYIWKLPISGGEPVQVSKRVGMLAIESTDGADLYYVETAAADRAGPLMRMPVAGGEPVKVLDNVIATSFDVLDRGIYYLERVAGDTNLKYFDFASGTSTHIAGDLGTVSFGLTASRDGRSILFSRVDLSTDELMLVDNFR